MSIDTSEELFCDIHPRLRQLANPLAHIFAIDEPTELHAILDDLQVLAYRCGYLLRHLRADRDWRRRAAKQRRLASTGTRYACRRGRPAGSAALAARQFGLGLAQIWFEQKGRPARRAFDWATAREYGPYRDFVKLVVTAFPRTLLVRSKGNVPSVDYLVRESIGEFRKAQLSPLEYRRRGLLAEERWLAGPNG